MEFKYLNSDTIDFYIWGIYHQYPSCCVNFFVEHVHTEDSKRDKLYEGVESHIVYGTGFMPCPNCIAKTKHMNKEEFINWLNRDIFSHKSKYELDILTGQYKAIKEYVIKEFMEGLNG